MKKKILVISYFFNYVNQKSTAISINTRIKGICEYFELEVACKKCNNPENLFSETEIKIHEFCEVCDENIEKNSFVKYCIKLFLEKNYELVIIHSNFFETNFLARELKKVKKIPIIGYLPDPYIDSVHKGLVSEKDYKNNVNSEKSFLLNCDLTIVTNAFFKNHYKNYYPELFDKIKVIPHSFVPELKLEVGNDYSFVFLGKTYFGRRLDNLYTAFDELLSENKELKKFKLITSYQSRVSTYRSISKIKNISNFIFLDQIDFKMAQKIESRAFCNINVALPVPNLNYDPYFPTKLAQFMKNKSLIFTISDTPGFSTKLMEDTKNSCSKNFVPEIKNCLRQLMNGEVIPDYSKYDEYSCENTAKIFLTEIQNLLFD